MSGGDGDPHTSRNSGSALRVATNAVRQLPPRLSTDTAAHACVTYTLYTAHNRTPCITTHLSRSTEVSMEFRYGTCTMRCLLTLRSRSDKMTCSR